MSAIAFVLLFVYGLLFWSYCCRLDGIELVLCRFQLVDLVFAVATSYFFSLLPSEERGKGGEGFFRTRFGLIGGEGGGGLFVWPIDLIFLTAAVTEATARAATDLLDHSSRLLSLHVDDTYRGYGAHINARTHARSACAGVSTWRSFTPLSQNKTDPHTHTHSERKEKKERKRRRRRMEKGDFVYKQTAVVTRCSHTKTVEQPRSEGESSKSYLFF